jgi:hypothetical protein
MRRSQFILFVMSAAILGSARADEGQPTNWVALRLPGKTLELIDDTRVEIYSFNDRGDVTATIGQKGGPLVGPIFYWRIKGTSLIISGSPGKPGITELDDPEVHGDIVSAKRTPGVKIEYRLTETSQQARPHE